MEYADSETVEYETVNEVIVENDEGDDLKGNIRTEIEAISNKIESGDEVQRNVLQDVYELLQAANALLNRTDDENTDGQSDRIETYYLTVNVDED